MGLLEVLFIIVVLAASAFANHFRPGRVVGRAIRKELKSQGCSSIHLDFLQGTRMARETFEVKFHAVKNQKVVKGEATARIKSLLSTDDISLSTRIFGEAPEIGKVPDGPSLADEVADLDLETRIRFETNQRVERLRADRDAFLEYDTNADGMVGPQEIEAARAKVEAQVRAEFLAGPVAPLIEAKEVHPSEEEDEGEDLW